MSHSIRRLEVADLDAVVALSLRAWAPVFASFEAVLGRALYGSLFPDWRVSQAAAVRATCTAPEHVVWVAVADGRPVGFAAAGPGTPRARALYERLGFTPLPIVRYYRRLG